MWKKSYEMFVRFRQHPGAHTDTQSVSTGFPFELGFKAVTTPVRQINRKTIQAEKLFDCDWIACWVGSLGCAGWERGNVKGKNPSSLFQTRSTAGPEKPDGFVFIL